MNKPWYDKFKIEVEDDEQSIPVRIGVLCASEALSESARGFLHSLQEHYNESGGLTERQYEALLKAEEDITPEAITRHNEWAASFDDEKRKLMNICAEYYSDSNYFYEMSSRVLNDAEYIPTCTAYHAMCENRYSLRVIEATLSEPKYQTGEVIALRRNAREVGSFKPGSMAVVIKSGHLPVTSAARGAKRYEVLPFGCAASVVVEERHLKKVVDKQQ
tara:strand:+ start:1484 stop:2137 length:654 start_codon:yes stop_codon:yes gene_type:complete